MAQPVSIPARIGGEQCVGQIRWQRAAIWRHRVGEHDRHQRERQPATNSSLRVTQTKRSRACGANSVRLEKDIHCELCGSIVARTSRSG